MSNFFSRTLKDYRSTLKEFEDFCDLIFYRPLSYLVVRASVPLRLTPSMLTTISFLLTILGAYFFFIGNYIPGAILIYVKTVFDCADGQLARYTKSCSKYGQMYDELVDMIGEILMFLGIFYSQYKIDQEFSLFFYLLAALVMMGLHLTVFQNFRMLYQEIYYDKNKDNNEKTKKESKLKNSFLFFAKIFEILKDKTYKLIYLPNINKIAKDEEDRERLKSIFKKTFKYEVYMFSFLAGTTHHLVMMGLLIANRVDLLFPAFIIYYNIAFAVMLLIHGVNLIIFKKKIK
ncbi:MAG: CDP-alcohol phosphatidyltransferase family protein [Spirochaetales bacterium]|nr:CDP-alcohol phosphatidyltransferase family protein [Spirochaetales bacterium]